MVLARVAHYSVRTADLEASRRFYVDVLGLRAGWRPPFCFPGIWLYAGPDDSDQGVVHLIGVALESGGALSAYLGEGAPSIGDTGPLGHVAFAADDWPSQRARCQAAGVRYAERHVPELGQLQIFLRDPSGVVIELNYDTSAD